MKKLLIAFALSTLLCGPSAAGVTFTFNYTDAPGVGFNDAANGAARQAALSLAGQNFATAFSGYNANIVMDVDGSASGSTLASAGSNSGSLVGTGFGLNEVIRNKVLSNGASDINAGAADGVVNVNWGIDWQLDQNATPNAMANQFDWFSTMYHEFAHAFGFSSGIVTDSAGMNPTDVFSQTVDGSWNKFDEFLVDKNDTSVFTGTSLDTATYSSLVTGGPSPAGGLFFKGPNTSSIGIYTPTTFEEGSSGSHLDDQNPALAGVMMLAATGPGPSARTFSEAERNIFRDIGYNMVGQITAIPEPSAFLFVGFGFMMLFSKRIMAKFGRRKV